MATINSAGLERIADGPVATVYSGFHARSVVALKVFPKRLDKRTLAAFNKEQAKLSTVRRVTSILPVDGVDELDTGEFAVRMERCTQSLAALVDRVGSLRPADAVVLGRAVAVALAAAHGAGVVHGGMSPHNILFRTTGEPVLADFGVTLRQAFARDPLYAVEFLPPETLRTGVLNEATDLYGLGAVLHYALSGRSPHPGRLGEQPGERVLRILGAPVPAINNPDVPVALSTLVARLLAADPARRLGDASAVADHLGAMLPGAPQRPTADDFDDFSNPHPAPVPPARQASPPPPVGVPAVGDEFDDFAVPAYPGRPAPPARPAVAPPRVGPPPVVPPPHARAPVAQASVTQAPVASPPVAQPPVVPAPVVAPPVPAAAPVAAEPPVAPPPAPEADEGDDAHWSPETEPAEDPAAGTADRAAQLRALRRERLRSASSTPRPADRGPSESAAQAAQDGAAPPPLPLATLTPAPPEPPAATSAAVATAPSAASSAEPPAAPAVVAPAPPSAPSPMTPSTASPGTSSALFPAPSSGLPPEPPTAALPTPATVEFRAQPRPPAVRHDLDFDDDFAGVANPRSGRGQVKVLAGPLPPPGQGPGKLIRYDLLAGAALLVALLALVPLLLFRGEPEEISSVPQLPSGGGSAGKDVEIKLAEPVELTDKVRLSWVAPEDLDFIVIVAAEGKETDYEPAERDLSVTLPVEDGLRYCFQVQASDGNDVYESNVVALRNATCRE